jgi:hypothetical protein
MWARVPVWPTCWPQPLCVGPAGHRILPPNLPCRTCTAASLRIHCCRSPIRSPQHLPLLLQSRLACAHCHKLPSLPRTSQLSHPLPARHCHRRNARGRALDDKPCAVSSRRAIRSHARRVPTYRPRGTRVSQRGHLCTALASSSPWIATPGQRCAASHHVTAAVAIAVVLAPVSAAERRGNGPVVL